jgi:hypothetical protein
VITLPPNSCYCHFIEHVEGEHHGRRLPTSVSGRDRPATPHAASSWMCVGGLVLELLTAPCTAYGSGAPHLTCRWRISHIHGRIGPTVARKRDHAGGRGVRSHARERARLLAAAIGQCSRLVLTVPGCRRRRSSAATAVVALLLPRSKRSLAAWNPAPPSSRAPTPLPHHPHISAPPWRPAPHALHQLEVIPSPRKPTTCYSRSGSAKTQGIDVS